MGTKLPLFRTFESLAAFALASRLAWDFAAALILFVCLSNSDNFVNRALSLPIWEPLARLTLGEDEIIPFPIFPTCT